MGVTTLLLADYNPVFDSIGRIFTDHRIPLITPVTSESRAKNSSWFSTKLGTLEHIKIKGPKDGAAHFFESPSFFVVSFISGLYRDTQLHLFWGLFNHPEFSWSVGNRCLCPAAPRISLKVTVAILDPAI